MKNKLLWICCALVVCLSLAQAAASAEQLSCSGREIVDGNGNPVRLRGIVLHGQDNITAENIADLKSWGCNFIRLLISYDSDYWDTVNGGVVDPCYRGILREQDLAIMDNVAGWCESNQIYWMFCLQPTYMGFNFELLYYPQDPDLYASQMSNIGGTIANRYKSYNYLLGYEPFGEPYGISTTAERAAYKQIAEAFIDAVRTYDPNRIVSVAACDGYADATSFNSQMRADRSNVIYAFSYYPCRSFVSYQSWYGDFRYPGRIPDFYRDKVIWLDNEWLWTFGLDDGVSTSTNWNVPVYCHEFGAWGNGAWDGSSPDNSSERFMRDMAQLFEDNSVNWIIWRWQAGASDVPVWWKALWAGQPNNRATVEPHGGTFVDSQTVTLQTFVNDANLYYTTDGSEPNASSTLYTGSFSITADTTVKAKVFKTGLSGQPTDVAVFNEGGRSADNPSNPISGLQYYYYEGDWSMVPNFETLTPVSTGTCTNFDPTLGAKVDGKALLWKGYINVPTGAVYYFNSRVSKAGGMEMYIGDTLTMLNGGNTTYSVGMLALEQGRHQIKMGYTRPTGADGLFSIEIQRPTDTYFVSIPSSMLYYNAAAPAKAQNPSPADDANDVPLNYVITWTPGADAVSHDVYFGKTNPPPFVQNQFNASFALSLLDGDTTYYWRIDEKNSYGTTMGDVWNFKTGYEKSPAAWWKFDEGSGLVAGDSSGNENNGQLMGSMSDSSWVPGRSGTALRFNGQTDYVQIPSASILDLGTDDFSFSMWLKKDTAGTRKFLYNQRVDGYNWYAMEWTAADIILAYGKIDGPECINVKSTTPLSAGTWYYVTVVVDKDSAANTKIYINGVDDTYGSPTVSSTDLSLNRDVFIGRWSGGNGQNFDGIIEDFRIYHWALCENERNELYKYGFLRGDIDMNHVVDSFDLKILVENWMHDDCTEPHWCLGADFDESGRVDMPDFVVFAENWLKKIE